MSKKATSFDAVRRRHDQNEQLNTGQVVGSNSAATFPILLLILIDSMGFGILTPLASALAPRSDSAICRGFSEDHRYLIYGFATGLYPMMIFFAAPILGQLSDRVGRKMILQVCAAGIVLGYVVVNTAFALGSVLLLMTGRVLGGGYRRESSNFNGCISRRLLSKEQGLLAEHGAAGIVVRLCYWCGTQRIARQQPHRFLVYHHTRRFMPPCFSPAWTWFCFQCYFGSLVDLVL